MRERERERERRSKNKTFVRERERERDKKSRQDLCERERERETKNENCCQKEPNFCHEEGKRVPSAFDWLEDMRNKSRNIVHYNVGIIIALL